MKIQKINESIKDNWCPPLYCCYVATTCYDHQERERICLKCWLDFCKTNNIEIEY